MDYEGNLEHPGLYFTHFSQFMTFNRLCVYWKHLWQLPTFLTCLVNNNPHVTLAITGNLLALKSRLDEYFINIGGAYRSLVTILYHPSVHKGQRTLRVFVLILSLDSLSALLLIKRQ